MHGSKHRGRGTRRLLKRMVVITAATVLAVAALFTIGVLWPTPELQPVRTRGPVAIRNVSIVDVWRALTIPGQTVLLDSGRIVATGPAATVRVPSGALIVDGTGKFVLPALWDMHVHIYAISP